LIVRWPAHWRVDGPFEGSRPDALVSHEIVQGGKRQSQSQTDRYVEAPSRLQDLPQNQKRARLAAAALVGGLLSPRDF
jgi:hypothetical protein